MPALNDLKKCLLASLIDSHRPRHRKKIAIVLTSSSMIAHFDWLKYLEDALKAFLGIYVGWCQVYCYQCQSCVRSQPELIWLCPGESSTSFPGPFPYLECGAGKGPALASAGHVPT